MPTAKAGLGDCPAFGLKDDPAGGVPEDPGSSRPAAVICPCYIGEGLLHGKGRGDGRHPISVYCFFMAATAAFAETAKSP